MKTDYDDIDISRYVLTTTDLRQLEDKITKRLIKIRDNLKISFIGRVSTGKSSIINSILGIDLLPVSSGQTTMYSIFISGNNDNILQLKEEGNLKTFKLIDQVKDYLLKIQNKKISKIEIQLPINTYKILEKCTLIDNPAIGYSDELDEHVLNQCYRSCYLYVLVIDAVASISDMEKKFLSALREKRQISEVKFLLNFSDCIKDDDFEIALSHHEKSIKKSIFDSDNIFVYSGYAYTENKIENINNYSNSMNSLENYVMMKEKLFRGETFVINKKILKFLRLKPSDEEITKFMKRLSENYNFRIERFIKCYVSGVNFLVETDNGSGIFQILNGLCKLSSKKEKIKKNGFNNVKKEKLDLFFDTIISQIKQIEKDLSKNSVDILKRDQFIEVWKNLENRWTDDVLEWNLRCILFFTDIFLITIHHPKVFDCKRIKEFTLEILNHTNLENSIFKKPYKNLIKKMKRKGLSFVRKDIIKDIQSILKSNKEQNQDLIICNSLIIIECYRKTVKKTSNLNCANQR